MLDELRLLPELRLLLELCLKHNAKYGSQSFNGKRGTVTPLPVTADILEAMMLPQRKVAE